MKYPKKGLGSYLLPFLLIIVLIGSGVYIAQNNVNFEDVKRIIQPPEVAKDEKVQVVFQEGNIEIKPWNDDSWSAFEEDQFIQVGDTVKVGTGSVLVLRFFEESEVRLDGNSELKLIRLDKDDVTGNHLAVDLINGRMWSRIQESNTPDGDFIINTSHQLVQVSKAALIDISINPEKTFVIGGTTTVNVAELNNGVRKPISRLELQGGQSLLLDPLTIDELKTGNKDVLSPLDKTYLNSEWYIWNIDKEEKLGLLVDLETTAPIVELEKLEPGLVKVTSHKEAQKVGTQLLLQGTFDADRITSVMVNGQKAILGVNGEWESSVNLSEQNNSIRVTAVESDSTTEKEALTLTLDVDATGPVIGKVTQPEVDSNGNGVLDSDSLELIGEVGSDAVKVCISHNNAESAYCLKQFTAGDETYRYLGSVGYGNVVSGKNKYEITAYDSLGNISKKTIYLFKDEPKPDSPIVDDNTTSDSTTESSQAELTRPVIENPDPNETAEVSESSITVSGTVDRASQSLLINDKKVSYEVGSGTFSVPVELSEGENIIKVQSVDKQGNRSKTALLTVIYLEPLDLKKDEPIE